VTRAQRAQVVELLRCAADRADLRGGEITLSGPYAVASRGYDLVVKSRAWAVRVDTMRDLHGRDGDVCDMSNDAYKACLLEAAQRVEEGTWP
jgi:hypothetical protein